MLIYSFLYCVLFVPWIYGKEVVQDSDRKMNNTTVVQQMNATKVTLESGAGVLVYNTSVLPISKQTYSTSMPGVLENKQVTISTKERVTQNDTLPKADGQGKSEESKNGSITHLPKTELNSLLDYPENNKEIKPEVHRVVKKPLNSSFLTNKPIIPEESQTESIKKPLFVSYDALANLYDGVKDTSMTSGIKMTSISDATISKNVRTNTASTNSHPGMVMPIVITILVVPMFGVLGYLALTRGREAWKNRHYKRMDFLLDGMYND